MNNNKQNKIEFKFNLLLIATFGFISIFATQSFGIASCNFLTETKNENRIVPISAFTKIHEYKETTNVPKGNCDRLGALNDEVGVKDCARFASNRGYNCFQVEDMQIKYTLIDNRGVHNIESRVIKSCYACLGN
ncbi:MAG: hypothetical protein AABY64_09310 [Bdellovibrionota bacterium]